MGNAQHAIPKNPCPLVTLTEDMPTETNIPDFHFSFAVRPGHYGM